MNTWDDLAPEQQKRIDALVLGGQKIEAIKLYQELTGAGLKQGKEAVEAREAELRRQSPERFPGKRSGCFAMVLLAFLAIFAICAAAQAAARAEDQVDNPEYLAWSGFKPGTSITRRTETQSRGHSIVEELTERLVGVSGEAITLELTTTSQLGTQTRRKDIPARIAKSQAIPIPSVPRGIQGESKVLPEEDVAVVDKTYRCQAMSFAGKDKGLNVRGTIWTSPAIPGGIVKSEMHADGQIRTKGATLPVEGITSTTTITALDVKQ